MNLSIRYRLTILVPLICLLLLGAGGGLGAPVQLHAEEFRFRYSAGTKFKALSEVDEEVYYNGRFAYNALILNRIAWEVKDVRRGSGLIDGTFITTEQLGIDRPVYEISSTYSSRYWRQADGTYDIEPDYYMPVVRNVPIFPEGDIEVGESWKAPGEEVHDLRRDYGIDVPLRIPFRASYRYLGQGEFKGKEYELISVQYTVRHQTSSYFTRYPLYPVRISGFSDQLIFWDGENGYPHAYTEQFSFIYSLSNGDEYEFTGTATTEITETVPMDRTRIAEEVQRRIEEGGVEDTEVSADERGVTLNLENIQFAPDSADLLPGEEDKLERIAEILGKYPDRDLLITGHTALAGTPEGRQRLSTDRAATIARYLLDRGIREREEILIEGKGASEPLADNSTPEGMRKNRRVEITILEN